ncbi:hypothetical protein evm_014301 [Chilo suppressalis]|nr:hypothetical protein evm_014301 [Chilo suppressalis]
MYRLGMWECSRTLVARAACDVALRLVGGGRRLEPRNAHQPPAAVALLGPHDGGAVGARCLRLLVAHGARGALHVAGAGPGAASEALRRELAALELDDVRPVALDRLPSPDIVLLALYDLQLDDPQHHYLSALGCDVEVKQLLQWSNIGWVTKNLLSLPPPCFGRHGKPLVPAASADISTHQSAVGLRGGSWPNLRRCRAKLHPYAKPKDQADRKGPGRRRFEPLGAGCDPKGEAGTGVPPPKDESSTPCEAEPVPYKAAVGGPV